MHDDVDQPSDGGVWDGLPRLGVGRHFSWSILEIVEEPDAPHRGPPGRRPVDLPVRLLTAEQEQELGRRIRSGTDPVTEQRTPDAQAAVHALVLANVRLCIRPALARRRGGQQFDDVLQNGLLGLIRAAERFDPAFGNRFSTYAMFWIRQSIDRQDAIEARTIRLPVHVIDIRRKLASAERDGRLTEDLSAEEVARIVQVDATQVHTAWASRHVMVPLDEVEEEFRARSAADPRHWEDSDDEPAPDWEETVDGSDATRVDDPRSDAVLDLLPSVTERELVVLQLYYGLEDSDEHTLEGIGEYFDLTRERVRQVRNAGLETIRWQLALRLANDPAVADELGLDVGSLALLPVEEAGRALAAPTGGPPVPVAPRKRSPRAADPLTRRRRAIRSILSDVRDMTSRSSFALPDGTDGPDDDERRIMDLIGPFTQEEPFLRTTLIETLAVDVEEAEQDALTRALVRTVTTAARAASTDGLPGADELARLLRLARALGWSTDTLAFDLVLRAVPRTSIELPIGSRVASTWHFDETVAEHVELRHRLHEHGRTFDLEWNSSFDDYLDLVIAEHLGHRSRKTFHAVLAGVPICDIPSFLGLRPGGRLTVLRSPLRIPWTWICRTCHRAASGRRVVGARAPDRCRDCAG